VLFHDLAAHLPGFVGRSKLPFHDPAQVGPDLEDSNQSEKTGQYQELAGRQGNGIGGDLVQQCAGREQGNIDRHQRRDNDDLVQHHVAKPDQRNHQRVQ
jgi:hypothetical protein